MAMIRVMGLENEFVRLIDAAPRVTCADCAEEMTLRTLMAAEESDHFTATDRCPRCGVDAKRAFTVEL
jgi:DNA-directed RNA polymerase subunit RPC12/RpoP